MIAWLRRWFAACPCCGARAKGQTTTDGHSILSCAGCSLPLEVNA